MNLQTLSAYALPWVKATRPQWRYALRNGIAMCLALSIAYALDLDEPYWAMTSAAVVSFPTVGGVISKKVLAASQAACSAPAPPAACRSSHSTIPGCFCSVSLRLAGCALPGPAPCSPTTSPAFQLAGYTCAIIRPFPVINISGDS